ncbi:hypothetical protein QBC42DRAFT_189870 [Cladorrhinum samala]|uniref:Uncharacterized protein n=1 Tax=Cladorrhinum samala TaxID=585594 RepID=A0AAV9HA32_9PEZI|nr:hypothetical protein QBC42DRAFT_189870 [Cladorrhinum samala]
MTSRPSSKLSASSAFAKHSAIRNSIRVRPPAGLKIKTSSLDLGLRDEKAQAMASSDWRKIGLNNRRRTDESGQRSSESSAGFGRPFELELEDLNPSSGKVRVTYHRPNEGETDWENTLSAPVWKMPPSVASSSSESRAAGSSSIRGFGLGFWSPKLEDVTMIQLKKVTPLIVPLNGENIALPNQLCLDVSPVALDGDFNEMSFGNLSEDMGRPTFGALKKISNRPRVRRLTSEQSYDTLDDLRQVLAHDRAVLVLRGVNQQVDSQSRKLSKDRTSCDSAISGFPDLHENRPASKTFARPAPAEEERFKKLLSRLQLPDKDVSTNAQPGTQKTEISDPAIIVAKPKNPACGNVPEQKKTGGSFFFGRDAKLVFATEARGSSGDSGYGSFHFGRGSDNFTSGTAVDQQDHLAPSQKQQASSSVSATSKKLNPAAAEFKSVTKGEAVAVISPRRITNPAYPEPGLGMSSLVPPLGNNTNIGTLPAPPGLAPITNQLAAPSSFKTFPAQPPPAPRPAFAQLASRSAPIVAPPTIPAPAPVAPGPIPLFGPEGKINRPYFPVTQKPRDHDPIKQQMYESYLEWRKANEPGYHIKCKMRQAHRVVRQYQNTTASPSATGDDRTVTTGDTNIAWKTIAEKAKAAVSAVAAAAAKEKKTREQSVREELKTKVRMASSAIEKREQPKTEPARNEEGTTVSATA